MALRKCTKLTTWLGVERLALGALLIWKRLARLLENTAEIKAQGCLVTGTRLVLVTCARQLTWEQVHILICVPCHCALEQQAVPVEWGEMER